MWRGEGGGGGAAARGSDGQRAACLFPHLLTRLDTHPSHPVNAVFNGYTVCVHPAFRTGEISANSDPFGGYSGGEDEMLAYLKANPQLAKKAGSAAVSIAQHNPEVSRAGAGRVRGGGRCRCQRARTAPALSLLKKGRKKKEGRRRGERG